MEAAKRRGGGRGVQGKIASRGERQGRQSEANSKLEIRNSKQIQMSKKQKILNSFLDLNFRFKAVSLFRISLFEIRICFDNS